MDAARIRPLRFHVQVCGHALDMILLDSTASPPRILPLSTTLLRIVHEAPVSLHNSLKIVMGPARKYGKARKSLRKSETKDKDSHTSCENYSAYKEPSIS